jgi:predicted lipoprotein
MESPQDRRELRRFQVHLPADVKIFNDGVHECATETRNVSARGVFFYIDHRAGAGSKIEFVLTFPPELTFTQSIRVRFTGTIVRMEEPGPDGKVGIAAAIEHHEFLTESAVTAC